MFRTAKTKIVSLALVGAVALGGAVYATTALAVGGASASTTTAQVSQTLAAQVTQTATDPQLRSSILDMLRDRMGLTGPQAEQFADQMIARMQDAGVGNNLQAMIDWCTQYVSGTTYGRGMMNWGTTPSTAPSKPSSTTPGNPLCRASPRSTQPGATPRGMMNGSGSVNGRGMMNWGTTPGTAPSSPSSATPSATLPQPSPQSIQPGLTPGGMMNGSVSVNGSGMMNGTTTPSTRLSDPSVAPPSLPGSQNSGSGFTPGGMMNGTNSMNGGRGGMMGSSGLS
jgi:hypothetical protein